MVRLDPHHPRRLDGAETDGEDRAERDRNLAEELARVTDPDRPVDPVDEPGRLDLSVEDGEERALVSLVGSELPGLRLMSAATRHTRSRSAVSRHSNTPIRPISSGVTVPVCPPPW